MEDLNLVISLAGTVFGLAATVLAVAAKYIKNYKAKKAVEQVLKISNIVLPLMCEAEKFTDLSGEEKKTFVLAKANVFAEKNSIPFDGALVSRKVEELISLTKQINVKTKKTKKQKTIDK